MPPQYATLILEYRMDAAQINILWPRVVLYGYGVDMVYRSGIYAKVVFGTSLNL